MARAQSQGYRSRAAYKLAELDDRFRLLSVGRTVLDLGAAPGGWSQVAAERVGTAGRVVAVDLAPLAPIPGVECHVLDLDDPEALDRLREALPAGAHVILSDMAAAATGHRATDALRAERLAGTAAAAARALLAPGGHFLAKVMRSGAESDLLAALKPVFRTVRHAKPGASRPDSSETYLIALKYAPPTGAPR